MTITTKGGKAAKKARKAEKRRLLENYGEMEDIDTGCSSIDPLPSPDEEEEEEEVKPSLTSDGENGASDRENGGSENGASDKEKAEEDLSTVAGRELSGLDVDDAEETKSGGDKMDDLDLDADAKASKKTARTKFRTCDNCSTEIIERILVCAGCKKVAYCNYRCQKANWKAHKKTCSYALKKEAKDRTG